MFVAAGNERKVAAVRAGIVGTGAIARRAHLPAARRSGTFQVVAVADVDRARAQAVATEFGVPAAYGSLEEMLKSSREIDAVVICTPNHLHAAQAIASLEAGKHVLVEKPMATSLDDARRMVALAKASRRVLMVGFTHRFYEFNRRARKLVSDGAIGTVLSFRVRFAHQGPYIAWPAESGWFLSRTQAGGGALIDMGIHAVDLVRWLTGSEVVEVSAMLANPDPEGEVDRIAHVVLRLQNGALGSIEVGWSSHDGAMGYELYGSEGTLIVDYRTPIRLLTPKNGYHGLTGWFQPNVPAGDPFVDEHRHFVGCIRGGLSPEPDGIAGKAALEVILAAYEAARAGRTVALQPSVSGASDVP